MKTKFNWGVFFWMLLIIACVASAFYGVLTALVLEQWWPMWFCAPGAILIAVSCAIDDGAQDEECSHQARHEP